jgi:hypothetical protein
MKRVWAGALGLVLGGLGLVRQAHADAKPSTTTPAAGSRVTPVGQPDEIVAKELATTKTFYGWQILATGEVGALMAAASVLLPERPLGSFVSSAGFVAGMPLFALGGPVVHWTHNNFNKGLISFGGNGAFLLAGGLAGQTIRCNKPDAPENCGARGFFTGLAVTILIAPVLDAAILGWEDVPVDYLGGGPRRHASRDANLGWTVAPTWSIGPRGAFQLGVSGSF